MPSPALGAFGGTGFLFLGRFGSQASTEKKGLGADYEQLLRVFFSCFRGQFKKKNLLQTL